MEQIKSIIFYSKINRFFEHSIILFISVSLFASCFFFVDKAFFLIFSFLFLYIVFYNKNFGNSKILIKVLLIWTLINILSIGFNRTTFSLITFSGYVLRISIGFFLVNLWNGHFWEKFEKLIFSLTFIALIIFPFNLLFPSFFHDLKIVFQPFTHEVFLQKDAQKDFWYSFFYTHSGRDDWRNSGFMWEPGAFAMSSVIMIIYNWSKSGFFFTKRILLYILAIITTVSTAGYISLIFLLFAVSLNKKRLIFLFSIIGLLLIFNTNFIYSEFLIPKIEEYIEETNSEIYHDQKITDRLEANRLSYLLINIVKTIDYPLGFGVVEDKKSYVSSIKIVGVGGVSDILYKWGPLGLATFLWTIFYWIRGNLFPKYGLFQHIFIFFALLIMFISNPIESNLVASLLFFTSFIPKNIKH
ncbi:hypothetical protein SAMN00777080_3246 [Aquiflexum balticum DSM 16537]|uniref:O-antigen ligase like membrane protein n=1 Tax=Aquiflexum balticum DSM 16537 TaxID=758820 RepID=A0A1W2H6V7_9BACT|nr:hypothetical protein [Aquiflexum balticum]SMD44621.1 hypothetical protein SAMN00777080_3246 [Aquiflexum balticum DSM 16537]